MELYVVIASFILGMSSGVAIFYGGFRVGIKTAYKQSNEEPYDEEYDGGLTQETE